MITSGALVALVVGAMVSAGLALALLLVLAIRDLINGELW